MTQYRPISRRTAERLLAGGAAGAEHERLAALLAAAAAGHPGAVPGEQRAVHAFRAAAPVAVSAAAAPYSASRLRRMLAVKVVAVAAALAMGGVAVAATTGHLPGPLGGGHPVATSIPSAGAPGTRGDTVPSAGPAEDALVGLCRAYASRTTSEQGKALDTPAFRALVEAAGGREQVDPYCQALLAGAAGHGRTAKPEKSPGHGEPSHPEPSKAHPSETQARPTPTASRRPGH